MGCFAAALSYAVGNGFIDGCLGLETTCSYSRGNGLINILGSPEDGFWFFNNLLLNGSLFGRRDNQSGWGVLDRWWGIVEAHPWNWLEKFNVLLPPWNFDLYAWLDELFVGRLQCAFQSLQSFKMGNVFGVLYPCNGVPQFGDGVDNGIRWCDRGLRYILVLEKHRVRQSFRSCLLAKNNVCSVVLI
jgi:hypothetical protein